MSESEYTLLRLVSRGNAVIAELHRLKAYVPEEFNGPDLDLSFQEYFEKEQYRASIRDPDLRRDLLPILERFYLVFESIVKYANDLVRLISDLDAGLFIQESLETMSQSSNGRQLLAESVYLMGVMLLVMDSSIAGPTREKMLVAYHRWKGFRGAWTEMEKVCQICRDTGLACHDGSSYSIPEHYPKVYFGRVKLPVHLVSTVLSILLTADIYSQTSHYPLSMSNLVQNIPSDLPESYFPLSSFRPVALSTQQSLLLICLFFSPQTLERDDAKMREIKERYFGQAWWVGCVHMGWLVDLRQLWKGWQAAEKALRIAPEDVEVHQSFMHRAREEMVKSATFLTNKLDELLAEGILTDEYILDNTTKILSCLRESNVILRWLLLHDTPLDFLCKPFSANIVEPPKSQRLKDKIQKKKEQLVEPVPKSIAALLLAAAHLEYLFKNQFSLLLAQKEEKWNEFRKEASERLLVAAYFAGEKPLTRVNKNEHLQSWFKNIGTRVVQLSYKGQISPAIGRTLIQLSLALEEVEEFHQLESYSQIKISLQEVRDNLKYMTKLLNAEEEVLVSLSSISDFSYAWRILPYYTKTFQEIIRRDSSMVIRLRAVFLKMASVLDLPLIRINQSESPDLISVSQFYSSELVAFVKKVVKVIPETMFELLGRIVQLETVQLQEFPTRLDKNQLKSFEKSVARFELSKHTYALSCLTEGLLAMKKTLMGVIEVDPLKLLEEGIRSEILHRLKNEFEALQNSDYNNFESALERVANNIDGLLRSISFIQDYVHMNGLLLWHDTIRSFWETQSESIVQSLLMTVVSALLARAGGGSGTSSAASSSWNFWKRPTVANPDVVVFLFKTMAFHRVQFQPPASTPVLDYPSIYSVAKVLGPGGLSALYQTFGKLIQILLRVLLKTLHFMYAQTVTEEECTVSSWLNSLLEKLGNSKTLPAKFSEVYPVLIMKFGKWLDAVDLTLILQNELLSTPLKSFLLTTTGRGSITFNQTLSNIGRLTLIREMIHEVLARECKQENSLLFSTCTTLSDILIYEAQVLFFTKPSSNWLTKQNLEGTLVESLQELCVSSGSARSVKSQVFVDEYTEDEAFLRSLHLILLLNLLGQISEMTFDEAAVVLISSQDDPACLASGIASVLAQFPPELTTQFCEACNQYVRLFLNAHSEDNNLMRNIGKLLSILRIISLRSPVVATAVNAIFPDHILRERVFLSMFEK